MTSTQKPKKLTKAEQREFLELVDDVNSHANGVRVVGRIRMSSFIAKHGRDVCDEFYNAYQGKLRERQK